MKQTSTHIARTADPLRPGDAIRVAKCDLETRIRSLILAFNAENGVSISAAELLYLESPASSGSAPQDVVVRITLET